VAVSDHLVPRLLDAERRAEARPRSREVGLFRFGSGPTNWPPPAPGPRLALKLFFQIRELLFDPLSPFLLAKLALLLLERD